MNPSEKKREFLLSFLDTQANQVNLKTIRRLIEFGKNNYYTVPEILTELVSMDQKHEKILTITLIVDYIGGAKLFNNDATHWLTASGKAYLQRLKAEEAHQHQQSLPEQFVSAVNYDAHIYEQLLTQLMQFKNDLPTEKDRVLLQELALDLRHLLTGSKTLERGSLSKFKHFINLNWDKFSPYLEPILLEFARVLLFEENA
ncbi:hypothetical protein ACNAN0_01615 [Agrilactobacillus fermenti]|uniref:hypothetical protein n=1 Tax=Agrilactobacillus fermenti TaxID=2586909 RepID=UPI001E5D8863|nr:hypothetical protein [Agrilactobacillus fermenti]MCD2257294.1 hypothetical protein [Agrilactobacillus fermenti]